MNENKSIDLMLLIIFVAGITALGFFMLNKFNIKEDKSPAPIIEHETPKLPQSHKSPQDYPISSKPKVSETPQIETPSEISEPLATVQTETMEEPSTPIETIHTPQQSLVEDSIEIPVQTNEKNQEEKSIISEDQNGKITLETKSRNGTIGTAQEIQEGLVKGAKKNADDTVDLFKIRASGKQMILSLESDLIAIDNRSVITIYDNKLKAIGEYFASMSTGMFLPVTPGKIYYIKMNLTSVKDDSFDYELRVKFGDFSREQDDPDKTH